MHKITYFNRLSYKIVKYIFVYMCASQQFLIFLLEIVFAFTQEANGKTPECSFGIFIHVSIRIQGFMCQRNSWKREIKYAHEVYGSRWIIDETCLGNATRLVYRLYSSNIFVMCAISSFSIERMDNYCEICMVYRIAHSTTTLFLVYAKVTALSKACI